MKTLKYLFIIGIFVLFFSGQAFSQAGWETILDGITITDMAIQGDNIWCATISGIICLNKKTMESKTNNVEGGLEDNTILSVAVDSNDNVWFGTYSGKIIKDDGQKWTVFSENEGLPASPVGMIYCGKDGKIWAATYEKGIYTFDGTKWDKFNFDFGIDNVHVMKMAVDSNNKIWFDTNYGLYLFDGVTLTEVGNKDGFPGDSIIRIRTDRNNVLWAVSFGGGIFRHDGSIWTEVVKDNPKELSILRKLSEPKTILFSIIQLEKTYYLANAEYIDFDFNNDCPEIGFAQPGEGKNFEYSFRDTTAYAREINDINSDGDLSDGLTLTIDDVQGAMEGSHLDWAYGQSLASKAMGAFDVSPNGTLWGGTMTGVVCYNGYNDEKITTFSESDGLAGGYVTSVIVDNDGIVWVGSEKGLSRYIPPTTSVNSDKNSPEAFKIIGNYPNPFNPETTISFSLTDEKQISLVIYNITGQEIKTLFSGKINSGSHNISWNGKNNAGLNVSSGIYIAVLKSGIQKVSHRMQLLR